MKTIARTIASQIVVFFWCIFMGITVVSIGLGAAYPPLNYIAKPFVCLNGQMIYQTSTSKPLPGTTYTSIGWYCVDQRTKKTTELGVFPIVLTAGPIYGLLIEVLVLFVMLLRALWRIVKTGMASTVSPGNSGTASYPTPLTLASEDSLDRMKELKQMRAENLISEAEYQQKREEILRGL